jgi:hypothetical protein
MRKLWPYALTWRRTLGNLKLKELINSWNCYLKPRYKKATWITTVDQYKQSVSKIYLSLLLPSK